MLHLFFKCLFQAFTFRSLNRWVLGMSLPRRLNRYDFLYWLIAYCGFNYLGSSCLHIVFSPLDTNEGIYTCGIAASWKYRQHPLDSSGSSTFLWSKDIPGFPKAGKIHSKSLTRWLIHLTCSGCSPVLCHILPVHWSAPNPLLLSTAVCSATGWNSAGCGASACACACVCVRHLRTPARGCIPQPDSLLGGAPVLARNDAVHRLLLLWCASAEQSHIPQYICVLLRHFCIPDPWQDSHAQKLTPWEGRNLIWEDIKVPAFHLDILCPV